MDLLHGCGWNWEDWFVKGVYPFEDLYDLPDAFSDDNFQFLHGVNVGEGTFFHTTIIDHVLMMMVQRSQGCSSHPPLHT